MAATLQVIPALGPPFEIRIGNVASIGRLPDSTVCLSSGPAVSRQHAVIRSHNGYDYQIVDLGSLNGTYVNAQRVVLPAKLEDRARILIADNEIVFEQMEESSEEYQKSTLVAKMGHSAYVSTFVALMVCDIRGFTMATETLSKDDLAQTVGGWFRLEGNLIQQTGGNIDKFMGDAFFAYWTNCQTAFETGRELLRLAETRKGPDPKGAFEVAVALHCGKVTCRNLGVMAERDATIMGDAVNVVFRLESLAKELSQPLLASHDFVTALGSVKSFVDLGNRVLKGKANPVRVFGLNRERADGNR